MRSTVILLLCAGALSLSGCAAFYQAPVVPPPGFVYSETKAPMDIFTDETELGSKVGKAESTSILGLVATGDCSIKAAADAGNITKVRHVDYEIFNILGVYSRFTTVVYGD